MAYKLIQKFADILDGHHPTILSGPFTPLILDVTWSRNPEIPLVLLCINRGRETVMSVDEYYYHLTAEDQFRKYFEKKVSKQELQDRYYSYAQASQDIYNEYISIQNLSVLEEGVLLDFFKKTVEVWHGVADTIYIETLDYDIALKVVGEENKLLLDHVWEQAIHPAFVSFEGRRLAYLVQLLRETDDVASLIPKVRYIYTDYHWTKSDEEIQADLEKIKARLPEHEKELIAVQANAAERKGAHDAWEQSLAPRERFLVEYIQMIMLFRDIRKDPIAHTQAVIIAVATELLKRAGIDPKYGLALNIYECAKGVAHLRSIKDDIIKRADGNISLTNTNSTIDIEFCDYEQAVEEFYVLTTKPSEGGAEDTLKGQIACKGKVTGTVRVVLDPQKAETFADGDILVTSMTRPEFVPLMKRAGAVVTNEGGITCHAAIVSRELGIPCVIGTKVATRFLKDGDQAEVDADNGIVRVTERI